MPVFPAQEDTLIAVLAKLEEIRAQLVEVLQNQMDAAMQSLELHTHDHDERERRDFH